MEELETLVATTSTVTAFGDPFGPLKTTWTGAAFYKSKFPVTVTA